MDIVLIPGFWLDGESWDEVAAPLRNAGHTVHTLTLPGLESRETDRSGIGLRDHVNAVVAVVDSLPDPVVLAGHSGGGAIAHAAADARPDRIARVIYVDSGPLAHGGVINDELPVVNGEVPLPDWSVFEEEDLVDLDESLRAKFRSIAIPEPVGVTSDKQVLSDDRRYDVPVSPSLPASSRPRCCAAGWQRVIPMWPSSPRSQTSSSSTCRPGTGPSSLGLVNSRQRSSPPSTDSRRGYRP